MVGWFVIRNIVAGSKFVYKNEHRAPQNLKNFVGDFSEVRITTNLPAGIYAEGIQVDFGNDSTPKSSRYTRRHLCRGKPNPRNQNLQHRPQGRFFICFPIHTKSSKVKIKKVAKSPLF